MKILLYIITFFVLLIPQISNAKDYSFSWSPNTETIDHYEICYGLTPQEADEGLNCVNVGNHIENGHVLGTLYGFSENTLYFFTAVACSTTECSDPSKKVASSTLTQVDVDGDYDGDGLKDNAISTNGYLMMDFANDGFNGLGCWDKIFHYNNYYETDTVFSNDYNRDGTTDIAFEDEHGICSIYIAPINFNNSNELLDNYSCLNHVNIGVFRPNEHKFYIKTPLYSGWIELSDGISEDLPIAGDWNGNSILDIGVFRPSAQAFYLRKLDGTWEELSNCGIPGDLPVAGDWNGDGKSQIGVFRPSAQAFYLRKLDGTWRAVNFGASIDLPLSFQ